MFIIEKNTRLTFTQRLIKVLCLLLPIGAAFLGYFLAPSISNFFAQKKTTELFKFLCSIVFFAIPTIIIFIFSRKKNPIIDIKISK